MTNRVRIIVTDEALYVANTGRAIDRQGVISISRQYLSSKGETPPVDTFDALSQTPGYGDGTRRRVQTRRTCWSL